MNYREVYEKAEKVSTEDSRIDAIISEAKKGQQIYESWQSGGLLSIATNDTDKKEGVLAFILEEHYGVPSAGIRYSVVFGIFKDDQKYLTGLSTVRGGTASENDDKHSWYNEIKILEIQDDTVVIGLKSNRALRIFKVNLNNRTRQLLEDYDFEAEAIQAQKEELEQEVQVVNNPQEKLEVHKKLISKNYEAGPPYEAKSIYFSEFHFGLIEVKVYDRDYDASVQYIDYYVLSDKDEKPKEVLTHNLAYDRSLPRKEKFFDVNAHTEINTPTREDGKIIISVKVKVVMRGDQGKPFGGWKKTLGEEGFKIIFEA